MRGIAGRAQSSPQRSPAREHIHEFQRSRVLGALREIVAEQGLAGCNVAQIVLRAGVSRRTFYELFADREDCFMAALEQSIAVATQRVLPRFQVPGRWHERVRAGLLALLELLDEQPELGALCLVHALGAAPAARARRARVVRALVDAVDEGRVETHGGRRPSPLTAEGVVGAVLAVLHARLSGETAEHGDAPTALSDLAGPLMSIIVLPYLGPAAAARELARPSPERAPINGPHRRRKDPLRDLEMRLTYRTVRVLDAIAARPGESNRYIATEAGIADQGQTSKLLRRLEGLGLIQNTTHTNPLRGEPNAWQLTRRGTQLRNAIQTQANPSVPAQANPSVPAQANPSVPAQANPSRR